MKVLCNFSVLFFQDVNLLRFLNKFSLGSEKMEFVPIDPEVVSYITASCPYKQVIVTVDNEDQKAHCDRMIELMQSCESNVSFACVYKSNLSDEYVREVVDTIITNDLSIFDRYAHVVNKVFVGSLFKSLWFLLKFKGNKVIKNKYLSGIISMLFAYFIEIFPYVLASTSYMAFVRMDVLNVQMSIPHFFSSILYCMFFKSFCELFYLCREWKSQQDLETIRCSGQFIDGTNNISVGSVYVILLAIASIVYSFKYSEGAIVGLFTGITYALSYNFNFPLRLLMGLLTAVIGYISTRL